AGVPILIDFDNARGSIPWARVVQGATTFTIVFSHAGYKDAEETINISQYFNPDTHADVFQRGALAMVPQHAVTLQWQPGLANLRYNPSLLQGVMVGVV